MSEDRPMTELTTCPECGSVVTVPAEGRTQAEVDAWRAARDKAVAGRMEARIAARQAGGQRS